MTHPQQPTETCPNCQGGEGFAQLACDVCHGTGTTEKRPTCSACGQDVNKFCPNGGHTRGTEKRPSFPKDVSQRQENSTEVEDSIISGDEAEQGAVDSSIHDDSISPLIWLNEKLYEFQIGSIKRREAGADHRENIIERTKVRDEILAYITRSTQQAVVGALEGLKAKAEDLLDWADENGDRESVEAVKVSDIDTAIARAKGDNVK